MQDHAGLAPGHVWQLSLRQRGSRAVQAAAPVFLAILAFKNFKWFWISLKTMIVSHRFLMALGASSAALTQEAIELCSTDEEREVIASELAGHIWEACRCPM